MPVTICAFDVKPDIARQLWYCDIEMDSGTAYFPFVRLALARYQVNSIRGAHLSPVVLADFAQLVPNRTASVVNNPKDANQVLVTVAGVPGTAGSQRQTIIEVEVEEANPAVGDELGWTPIESRGPITLPRVNAQQWTGSVTLPAPTGKQYRLVIKEFEVFNILKEADSAQSPRKDKRVGLCRCITNQSLKGLLKKSTSPVLAIFPYSRNSRYALCAKKAAALLDLASPKRLRAGERTFLNRPAILVFKVILGLFANGKSYYSTLHKGGEKVW